MPAPEGTSTLEHEIRIDARPETVFQFFTDPAKLVEWMGEEAMLDPRPGGVCRLAFNPAAVVSGKFVEVEPYSRLVFTWGWEAEMFAVPPASTEVAIELTPEGDSTLLRLTHRALPEAAVRFHTVGWQHYLRRLGAVAAGHDPGPDAAPGVVDPSLIPGRGKGDLQ